MADQTYNDAGAAPSAEPKKSAGRSMAYGQLSIRSPDYDLETWQLLDDLHKGGFEIEKRAGKYIPQLTGEHLTRYNERLKSASYINYFGTIVAFFVSALFTQEITVTEAQDSDDESTPGGKADVGFYGEFAKNADGKGLPLQKVLRNLLTTALKKRRALLIVDFPKPAVDEVRNRADEEAAGLDKVWCCEVPIEQVIDWDCDEETGEYTWLIVNRVEQRRRSPAETRGTIVESFKVWERDEDGTIRWSLFQISYPANKPPKPKTPVPLVDEGKVSFKRIPVLEFCLPEELWVGNKIGTNAREHYQRRTSLNGAENKSLVALPVVAKGSEFGAPGAAMPAEVQQNPRRIGDPQAAWASRGFVETGAGDKVYFAEPEGRCYELVDKQLDALKDEMFRVVHQIAMSVGNDSTAMRRSGESKKQDKSDLATVLGALGSEVRAFAVKLYETIAAARNDDVVWTPHGLDDYDTEERADLIAEAGAMGTLDIPSATFWKQYKTQIALKLAQNLPPETQEQIRKEIQDGVEAEQQIRSVMDQQVAVDEVDPNADPNDPNAGTQQPPHGAPGGASGGAAGGDPGAKAAGTTAGAAGPPPAASPAKAGVAKPAAKSASPKPGIAKAAQQPAVAAPAKKTVQGADGSTHELFDPADRMRASDESPGIAEKVYRDLSEDYDEAQLGWVRHAQWRGPLVVPLSEIDWTNADSWPASEDEDHVDEFVERIKSDGYVKPIILVNEPNNDKLIIADGHHRALAYRKLGQNPMAYVANVGAVLQDGGENDWRVMHDSQSGGSDQK